MPRDAAALRAGVRWLLEMQNRNGSWGCFVRGSTRSLDAPSPEMSAHAVVGLRRAGVSPRHPAVARARWLERAQCPDGSLETLWYRSRTGGTGGALEAFAACGLTEGPAARRCSAWLFDHQCADGGWGLEDRESSVEEMSWALNGLLAAGVPATDARVAGAAAWLGERQQASGAWSPSIVGIYFSSLMYHNDHLASGYALQALGRYRRALLAEEL